MGQHMNHIGEYKKVDENGYESLVHTYRAQRCTGCPLRVQCYKAKAEQEPSRSTIT